MCIPNTEWRGACDRLREQGVERCSASLLYHKGELLAVVKFVKYYRTYLWGRHFRVHTDHASLRWLLNFKDPEGMLARWLSVLDTYDFEIVH